MTIAQSDRSDKFPPDITALRLQLRRNGLHPLPVHADSLSYPLPIRTPFMPDWFKTNDEDIRFWEKSCRDEICTGIAAKFTPALLIDSLIGPAAEAAEKVAREYLAKRGDIYAYFCGSTRLIPLKTDKPFAKLSRELFAPDDTIHTIEILGDGQVYVVDGSVDGNNTRWLGGELASIKREKLPSTQHKDAKQLLDAIVKVWIEQFGFILKTPANELKWVRRQVRLARARVEARKAANPEPTPQTLQELRKLILGLRENHKELSFTIDDITFVLDREAIVGLKENNKEPNFTVDDIITLLDACCSDFIVDWRDRLRHHVETIWAELKPAARERKIIRIAKGEIARIVDEAEAALLAVADVAPIMVRAGMLVQPIIDQLPASHGRMTQVVLLRPLTNANVVYLLNKHAAIFAHYDGRSKKWLAIDPPPSVATQLLEKGHWQFPKVAGVITAPTLRPDGSVLDQPGYDPATQLWYAPDRGFVIPPRVECPTREQAEQALALLQGLLVNFPFVNDVDLAVALAAILTPVLRGAFDVTPMNLFRAPDFGTGKSFLADLISIIARGRPCQSSPTSTRSRKWKNASARSCSKVCH